MQFDIIIIKDWDKFAPSSFGVDISVLKLELQFDVGSGVDKLIWIYVIDEQALVL